MTAVVALVGRRAAYLASDTAIWWPDGRIQAIGRKIEAHPTLNTAFVATGVLSRRLLAYETHDSKDLTDLHSRLADFVRSNLDRVSCESRWSETLDQAAQMTIRGASWLSGAPVLWTIDPAFGDLDPRHLGTAWWSPDIDTGAALGKPIQTRDDVYGLDPRAVIPPMMQAQRQTQVDIGFGPIHVCGGACELATVDQAGVTIETLTAWPEDKIGERISL